MSMIQPLICINISSTLRIRELFKLIFLIWLLSNFTFKAPSSYKILYICKKSKWNCHIVMSLFMKNVIKLIERIKSNDLFTKIFTWFCMNRDVIQECRVHVQRFIHGPRKSDDKLKTGSICFCPCVFQIQLILEQRRGWERIRQSCYRLIKYCGRLFRNQLQHEEWH